MRTSHRPPPADVPFLVLVLGAILALLVGCAPRASGGAADRGGGGGGEGGGEIHDVIERGSPPGGGALLVAFDDGGALVVADLDRGAIVARRELGEGTPTDVAVDPDRGRIVVVLEREEDYARLVEVAWSGDALGPPVDLASTAGRARIALVEEGVLVASDADGPRVRLVRDDGAPTRGRALGQPRSWWWDGGLDEVHGLELPRGGEAIRFTIGVDDTGSAAIVERRPLGLAPEEARLVPVAPGDERLVVLVEEGGEVEAVPVPAASGAGGPATEAAAGGHVTLARGVVRLEGAIGWPLADGRRPVACGGAARGLAVVTAEPPSVAVATLDGAATATIALAAEPPSGSPYGRRDLAVVGGSLLVATRARVVALREEPDPAGPSLDATVLRIVESRAFRGETLRGPLGCLPR